MDIDQARSLVKRFAKQYHSVVNSMGGKVPEEWTQLYADYQISTFQTGTRTVFPKLAQRIREVNFPISDDNEPANSSAASGSGTSPEVPPIAGYNLAAEDTGQSAGASAVAASGPAPRSNTAPTPATAPAGPQLQLGEALLAPAADPMQVPQGQHSLTQALQPSPPPTMDEMRALLAKAFGPQDAGPSAPLAAASPSSPVSGDSPSTPGRANSAPASPKRSSLLWQPGRPPLPPGKVRVTSPPTLQASLQVEAAGMSSSGRRHSTSSLDRLLGQQRPLRLGLARRTAAAATPADDADSRPPGNHLPEENALQRIQDFSQAAPPELCSLRDVLGRYHMPLIRLPAPTGSCEDLVCAGTTPEWSHYTVQLLGTDAREVSDFFLQGQYFLLLGDRRPSSGASFYDMLELKMGSAALASILRDKRETILAAATAAHPMPEDASANSHAEALRKHLLHINNAAKDALLAFVVPASGSSLAHFRQFAALNVDKFRDPSTLMASITQGQALVGKDGAGKPLAPDNLCLSMAVILLDGLCPAMRNCDPNSRATIQALGTQTIQRMCRELQPAVYWEEVMEEGRVPSVKDFTAEVARQFHLRESWRSAIPAKWEYYPHRPWWLSGPKDPPPRRSSSPAPSDNTAENGSTAGTKKKKKWRRGGNSNRRDVSAAAAAAADKPPTGGRENQGRGAQGNAGQAKDNNNASQGCPHGCLQAHPGGEGQCPLHVPWQFQDYALSPQAPRRAFLYLKGRALQGLASNKWTEDQYNAYWAHREAKYPELARWYSPATRGGQGTAAPPNTGYRQGPPQYSGGGGRGGGQGGGRGFGRGQGSYGPMAALQEEEWDTLSYTDHPAASTNAPSVVSNVSDPWTFLHHMRNNSAFRHSMRQMLDLDTSPFADGMSQGRIHMSPLLDYDCGTSAGTYLPAGGVCPSPAAYTTGQEDLFAAVLNGKLPQTSTEVSAALQSFQSEPSSELTAEANLNKAVRPTATPADPIVRASTSITPAQLRVEATSLQLQLATFQQRVRMHLPSLLTLPAEVNQAQQRTNDLARRLDRFLQENPGATAPSLLSSANDVTSSETPPGRLPVASLMMAATAARHKQAPDSVSPGYMELLRLYAKQCKDRPPIKVQYKGVKYTVGFFVTSDERLGITLCGPNGKRIMVPKNLVDCGSILCACDEDLAREMGLVLEPAFRTVVACNGETIHMRWLCKHALFYIPLPDGRDHLFTVPMWVMPRNRHLRMIFGVTGLVNDDISFVVDLARRCLVVRPHLMSGGSNAVQFEIPLDCTEPATAAAALPMGFQDCEESTGMVCALQAPMAEEEESEEDPLDYDAYLHMKFHEAPDNNDQAFRVNERWASHLLHQLPVNEVWVSDRDLYAHFVRSQADHPAFHAADNFSMEVSNSFDCAITADKPEVLTDGNLLAEALYTRYRVGTPLLAHSMIAFSGEDPVFGNYNYLSNPSGIGPRVQGSFYLSPARVMDRDVYKHPNAGAGYQTGTEAFHDRRLVSFELGHRLDFFDSSAANAAYTQFKDSPDWRPRWIRQPVNPPVTAPLLLATGLPPSIADRINRVRTITWHEFGGTLLQVRPKQDPEQPMSRAFKACLAYAALRYFGACEATTIAADEGLGELYIEWRGIAPLDGPAVFQKAYSHLLDCVPVEQAAYKLRIPYNLAVSSPSSRLDHTATRYDLDHLLPGFYAITGTGGAIKHPGQVKHVDCPVIPPLSPFWEMQRFIDEKQWGIWLWEEDARYPTRDRAFTEAATELLQHPDRLDPYMVPYRVYLLEYGLLALFTDKPNPPPDHLDKVLCKLDGWAATMPFLAATIRPTPGIPSVPTARLAHLEMSSVAGHWANRRIVNSTNAPESYVCVPVSLAPLRDPGEQYTAVPGALDENEDLRPIRVETFNPTPSAAHGPATTPDPTQAGPSYTAAAPSGTPPGLE